MDTEQFQPLKLYYILRKNKKRKDGTIPIYLRICVNGTRSELSIGRSIELKRWDSDKRQAKGNDMKSNSLNSYLDIIKTKVHEAHRQLLREDQKITAKGIKYRLTGKDAKKDSKPILDLFKSHNEKMKELVGKDYAEGTYNRYCTCKSHLEDFLAKEHRKDYPISEVDLEFIEGFEHYLKTKKNPCGHNSALKYVYNFKKIVRIALKKGWLEDDPFMEFDQTLNKKQPVHLTQEELTRIENKHFETERLRRVRDVFVFCCYTGLSYTDARRATHTDIKSNSKGRPYLDITRRKTKEPATIPLLQKAQEIIEKYKDDPETADGKLLPIISNQKTNEYLKEIATLAEVDKKLTTHVARHTCATTVLLSNGVPVETVRDILGHSKLSTTMYYARVTANKLHEDMEDLEKRLGG